jgi:hypothetical protein
MTSWPLADTSRLDGVYILRLGDAFLASERCLGGKAASVASFVGRAGQDNEVNDLVASGRSSHLDGVYILRLGDAFVASEGCMF